MALGRGRALGVGVGVVEVRDNHGPQPRPPRAGLDAGAPAGSSSRSTLAAVPEPPNKPDTLDPEVVERLITRDLEEHRGKPLSRRTLETQRSLESYLRAGIRPRWSERLMEIERYTREHWRSLERRLGQLRESIADPAVLAARWAEVAATWDFGQVNDLVRQHNQWYPVERDLPMNPRTGEYLPVMGRSYRRSELDAAWVLREFPA